MKNFPKQQSFFWSVIVCFLIVRLFITVLHNSYKILFLHIFHIPDSSATQWVFNCKVSPSLKESSLVFWCNETLNNCMSLQMRTSYISHYNWSTGIGIWNETPQLICQCLVMPSQLFNMYRAGLRYIRTWISAQKPAVVSCLTNVLAPPLIALESCWTAQTDRPV